MAARRGKKRERRRRSDLPFLFSLPRSFSFFLLLRLQRPQPRCQPLAHRCSPISHANEGGEEPLERRRGRRVRGARGPLPFPSSSSSSSSLAAVASTLPPPLPPPERHRQQLRHRPGVVRGNAGPEVSLLMLLLGSRRRGRYNKSSGSSSSTLLRRLPARPRRRPHGSDRRGVREAERDGLSSSWVPRRRRRRRKRRERVHEQGAARLSPPFAAEEQQRRGGRRGGRRSSAGAGAGDGGGAAAARARELAHLLLLPLCLQLEHLPGRGRHRRRGGERAPRERRVRSASPFFVAFGVDDDDDASSSSSARSASSFLGPQPRASRPALKRAAGGDTARVDG